ncbi:25903_t:CDS:2, partial [Dentiscutata erythropus]
MEGSTMLIDIIQCTYPENPRSFEWGYFAASHLMVTVTRGIQTYPDNSRKSRRHKSSKRTNVPSPKERTNISGLYNLDRHIVREMNGKKEMYLPQSLLYEDLLEERFGEVRGKSIKNDKE